MSFTGNDYHQKFELICRELPFERDEREVRSKLLQLEWIFWEALRGVFFWISLAISGLLVFPFYAFVVPESDKTMIANIIAIAVYALLATMVYWICRAVFHFEFAANIAGRKYGDPFQPR
ncbi:hypothetical protein FVA81_24010 [Rhizobium sp. WL3]|uniref:hypothetical protein n=1 Tax=Rhizobium sp. WL3 TaxID=2603277 RepID=UPI0011C1E919|nr:hypothetical protein [Rhizobium sp. WL3]QEE47481.1 hypothetical protein FVA81_24010 [Rhizobium sp. WL3]